MLSDYPAFIPDRLPRGSARSVAWNVGFRCTEPRVISVAPHAFDANHPTATRHTHGNPVQQLAEENTMSFERHHPNREVDRNLAKARDLRSAYLFACLAAIAELMARAWRAGRRGSEQPGLQLPVPPTGKQPV